MTDITLQRQLMISDPVREYNEDIGGSVAGAAWTLDGATGVTDDTHTDAPSDGHWYVTKFDEHLRAHVQDDSKSLSEHVTDAIKQVRDRFNDFVTIDDIDAAAEPSATGAIVRWVGNTLEYFVLCDSSVLVVDGTDVTTHVTDTRIAQLEKEVRKQARELKQQGLGREEARQRMMPTLRENRRKKNTEGNYWVLSFDPEAAKHGLTGRWGISDCSFVYLFTDGFARLVTTYNAYPDWEAASLEIQQSGIEAAVDELRRIERNDPEADKHFRLKQSDDATVIKLSFVGEPAAP